MRLTIRKKLIYSFVFIISSFILIGLMNYNRQSNFKKQMDIVSGKMHKLQKKSQRSKLLIKQILLDVLNRNSRRKVRSIDIIARLDKMAIRFYKNIDDIIEYGDHNNPVLERIRVLFQQFYILSKRVSAYSDNQEVSKYPDTMILYINIEKKLQQLIDQVNLSYETEFEHALLKMSEDSEKNIYFSTLLILYGIFFSIFIFFKLTKTIMNPIKELLNAIHNFDNKGKGKAKIFFDDEFGKMAKAFNELSGSLKGTINNLKLEVKERKKAENDLVKLKDILVNSINSMPSILIGINDDQIITLWNNAAVIETSIKTELAIGQKLSDTLPICRQIEGIVAESIKFRELRNELIIIEKKESKIKYLDATVFPLKGNFEDGAMIRIDDITERKTMEEVIIQTEKMNLVGELAAGMAHDFNNVLGGIIGTLSLIKVKRKKESMTVEKMDDYLEDMNKSADRATKIVRQLLTLSSKQELSLQILDLNTVIKNIVKICKSTFDKSIKIRPSYSKTPAVTKSDLVQIEQVLLNLVINSSHAMTFMREKGEGWGGVLEIGLRSFYADKTFCEKFTDAREIYYWELFVQDDGVGISDKVKAKIFDPFFTTKEGEKGTGLGLSMVYNVIKQHNGFMNFHSEIGKGTKFSLYLPKFSTDDSGETINRELDKALDFKGLALVVDDEVIIRKISSAILSEIGFNVIEANDGEEGIKIFNENKENIKFVVLDLIMPKISGYEVLKEIKKLNKDLKILIASGLKKNKRLKELLKYTNVTFIEKPYSFEQLKVAVKNLMNKK